MFNIFRSAQERAADSITAFVRETLCAQEGIPATVMSDPYCLGFLRMVGVHIASQTLPKGSGINAAVAAFEFALTQFAPRQARAVVAVLPSLKEDQVFLRGTEDGDLFMGWKLLGLAPERDGHAALMRFFDRAKATETSAAAAAASRDVADVGGSRPATAGAWQVTGGGHEYRLSRRYAWPHQLTAGKDADLEIICAVISSKEANFIVSDLRFRFRPLRPRGRSLVLGLFTEQPKGALVEVEALLDMEEVGGAPDEAVLIPHTEDISKLLRALTSENELQFMLAAPAPPDQPPCLSDRPDFLAGCALPNDGTFKALYEKACEDVAVCQDATRARQLGESWYRRRTPGLYFE